MLHSLQVNYLDSSAADLKGKPCMSVSCDFLSRSCDLAVCHVTALDSDQSSYKQSDEEESELESDVEDVEFSREW